MSKFPPVVKGKTGPRQTIVFPRSIYFTKGKKKKQHFEFSHFVADWLDELLGVITKLNVKRCKTEFVSIIL